MRTSSKLLLILPLALPAAFARPAGAGVLLSQQQALDLAFGPGAQVERRTVYLSEAQRKTAQDRGRVKVESSVWTYYVGLSSGAPIYAYFDTHVVRTMPETFMAVLEPDGRVRFIELLAFLEPDDYLPKPRWLDQFKGRGPGDDLMARRGIRNMTGSSLTSEALADGVRRVLAVHELVRAAEAAQKVQSRR